MLYPGFSCISSLCLTPVIIDKVLKSNGSLKITVDVNFSLLIAGNLNPNLRGLAIIFDSAKSLGTYSSVSLGRFKSQYDGFVNKLFALSIALPTFPAPVL